MLLSLYTDKVHQRIKRNWRIPPGVPTDGNLATGVFFKVDGTGRVFDVRINKSSGNAAFDQYCLDAIRKSVPSFRFRRRSLRLRRKKKEWTSPSKTSRIVNLRLAEENEFACTTWRDRLEQDRQVRRDFDVVLNDNGKKQAQSFGVCLKGVEISAGVFEPTSPGDIHGGGDCEAPTVLRSRRTEAPLREMDQGNSKGFSSRR
ncbi:MAG: energy transducer TonB [Thermodesulfobacteriota bacterium]